MFDEMHEHPCAPTHPSFLLNKYSDHVSYSGAKDTSFPAVVTSIDSFFSIVSDIAERQEQVAATTAATAAATTSAAPS
jgi:hypothetical protein